MHSTKTLYIPDKYSSAVRAAEKKYGRRFSAIVCALIEDYLINNGVEF